MANRRYGSSFKSDDWLKGEKFDINWVKILIALLLVVSLVVLLVDVNNRVFISSILTTLASLLVLWNDRTNAIFIILLILSVAVLIGVAQEYSSLDIELLRVVSASLGTIVVGLAFLDI